MPIWAADNDVFGNRHEPDWWCRQGETAWLKLMDKIASRKSGTDPLFVLLPDVVADWRRTVERAWCYRSEARDRGLPFAVALQDGCDFAEAWELRPEWVFVGGSTEWKLQAIEPASAFFHERGAKVHVGRVNGRNRLQACLRCGVDSVDGTGWARFTDSELPKLRRTLGNWKDQLRWEL